MKMTEVILSVVLAVSISIASWALLKVIYLSEQVVELRTLLTSSTEDKQDETISKFWKIHGWTKSQILELRVKNGLPIVSWPDF